MGVKEGGRGEVELVQSQGENLFLLFQTKTLTEAPPCFFYVPTLEIESNLLHRLTSREREVNSQSSKYKSWAGRSPIYWRTLRDEFND